MNTFQFRQKILSDDAWITSIADKLWGGAEIVSKAHTYDILTIPNIIAEQNGKPVGFIMYAKEGSACEIVALYTAVGKQGIGTSLITRVKEQVKKDGCTKLWLLTTNDNIDAVRFYQKRGFAVVAVRRGEIDRQRAEKPAIPKTGFHGIPIRDEIELETAI
jgi:ribosomal protein S18 acetylase RimI-like enzyme